MKMSYFSHCLGANFRLAIWHWFSDYSTLKGLGHAILSNFSTDQMVMELTKMWK